ncbi:MAG: electron transfer flavoprotein subunit beta/FixA family protein [Gammaproteobacteria bacterium]|jgi:electron transfer flavoprotein beta subunit|nr:electron transfer flavoprotein subunit beta/FixA family protein [Gammaproteobacteria bacterium]MBK8990831.1 electron transfer flavoprotein subunit beta/FixA family protein [Gammaproteobacteria bacterium]MBK9466623.1 electron transfer flavoprotein subunit beta/FixA family protein [Gammaproteobacteria bacterium]MBP6482969.1 electron transfer flavoprotein subunit beta/FixA family protein [Pseudomonadales bacterium]MBP7909514.1 electron transfer flavoprotein subunit beta/FixA family protein [Pse
MRIVVCIKEVLDPSAVNNYALAGSLKIAADGRTLDVPGIPRLINAYDEQALEAALRLRDAGCECHITAVSIGRELQDPLKHCAALGADEIVSIDADPGALDHHVVANILAAYIRSSGGADLVLCGRQASDDDQGVVPALLGESLDMPVAPIARALALQDGRLRVTRVTPDGDEVLEGALPAVVTISNELGEPRFPSARDKMAARKKQAVAVSVADLGLTDEQLTPGVVLAKQYLPEIHGHCEFIEGTPADAAAALIARLRADKLI